MSATVSEFNVTFSFAAPGTRWAPGTVTNVVAVSASPPTLAPTQPPNPTGGVTLDPAHTAGIVVRGQVVMNLSISDSAGAVYYPVGIAFQEQPGGQAPVGVFPPVTLSQPPTTTLTVQDNNPMDVRQPYPYDFVILFQDGRGNFGVLDPMITNQV